MGSSASRENTMATLVNGIYFSGATEEENLKRHFFKKKKKNYSKGFHIYM
jgi:hypothetical protein